MRQTMVIEPVRAFNGMDVLVACDEGLFAAEGLEVRFASQQPGDLRSSDALPAAEKPEHQRQEKAQ